MTARINLSGRFWAIVGIVVGVVVSIAANVAHSLVPPSGAPAGWRVEAGAVVSAVVWPVFLFIAVEILARTTWPGGRFWQIFRFAGLPPVALVAAFVSYRHLSGLLIHYGEERLVAYVGPIAVDGLMVMATAALIAAGHTRTTTSVFAPAAAPATLSGPATPTVISAFTPAPSAQPPSRPEPPAPAPEAVPAPSPAVLAARITPTRPTATAAPAAVVPSGSRPTRTRNSSTAASSAPKLAPSTIDIPVSESDAAQLSLPVVPAELLARAATVAGDYQTEHGTPITAGQLAVRLKVTSELAAHILAYTTNPMTPTVNGRPVKANR